MRSLKFVLFAGFIGILNACSTINNGVSLKHEPAMKSKMKPYTVAGITYYPQKDANEPYSEIGYATWYGEKYHRQPTATGEIFDMDKVSAAHPTLTLPSYARVTVLETGKSLIVRVNDRGPFSGMVTGKEKRIIDLSKQAAKELGILEKGVARVKVEKILP